MQQSSFPVPDWGSFLVAAIALAQPWIIWLYRKYRAGTVHVYEKANIEIGFSNFGPTVALLGTLRATDHDVFVRRMRLEVRRQKDSARHRFEWRAFRSGRASLGGQDERYAEAAGSFLLTTTPPHQYDVFFATPEFASEHGALASSLLERWRSFVRRRIEDEGPSLSTQLARVLEDPGAFETLLEEFKKTPEPLELYSALDRGFYWNPGQYDLTLSIETAKPEAAFESRWSFELSEEDSKFLRLNVVSVIDVIIGHNVQFNFAYPAYDPPRAAG